MAKKVKAEGHFIILHTCRSGEPLQRAVDWCAEQGLVFDAVNENLKFMVKALGDTRKVFANVYVDDKNVSIENFMNGEFKL